MPDDPQDPFAQQEQEFLNAGQLAQHVALLRQQLAQAREQGQPSGARYTTGAGAMMGGLGDVLRAFLSARKEKELGGQIAAETAQQGKARSDFMDLVRRGGLPAQQPQAAPPQAGGDQGIPPMLARPPEGGAAPDLSSLTAEPTPLEVAKARANALRARTAPQSPQDRADELRRYQALARLGMLSGDPSLVQYGKEELQNTQKLLAQGETAREHDEIARHNRALESQATQNADTRSPAYQIVSGDDGSQFYANPRDPRQPAVQIMGPNGQPIMKPKKPAAQLDPMLKALEQDLDPNSYRAGEMKANQARLNAAQRLLALARDPLTGGPANLTPQQMSELSTAGAALIGGGSSGEATRHELTPYTKGRSWAEVMQWLTDKPQGTEQQAFVKQLMDTADRESGQAQQAIRKAQVQRLPRHQQLFAAYPDEAQNLLGSYGFEPGEVDMTTGRYTPKQNAAAQIAGARGGRPDVRGRLAQLRKSGASADAIKQALDAEYTGAEINAALGGGK